jgi:hypothetical protein
MLNALVTVMLLLAGQASQPTGVITGTVAAPQQEVAQRVQVILLPPRYTDLWVTEVQKRLDLYWQRYQPTFRNQKEVFLEFSKQAHRDATTYVLDRMRRDGSGNLSAYLTEISAGSHFEFRNVPFGEYKVLALTRVGNQDVIWQEFVDLRSATPHFLELKKRVP